MARRSPARLLAPLALVGFVIALLVVINGAGSDGGSEKHRSQAGRDRDRHAHEEAEGPQARRKRYTVKAGDTPSGIAEKTGVPLSQILELNPDLDDQTLTVGDKLKLRP